MPSGEVAAIVPAAPTATNTPFPYAIEVHWALGNVRAVAVNAVTGVVTSAAKAVYEEVKYDAVLFSGKYPGADRA